MADKITEEKDLDNKSEKKKSKIIYFAALHIMLLVFSLGSVCSKIAAGKEVLSPGFFIFYGLVLFILFVYAIVWQQLLKGLNLVTAYANKAVTVIWGLVWGSLIFNETVTIKNIIGAAIIIFGVYLVVSGDE